MVYSSSTLLTAASLLRLDSASCLCVCVFVSLCLLHDSFHLCVRNHDEILHTSNESKNSAAERDSNEDDGIQKTSGVNEIVQSKTNKK